jgi:WS/DGAT/MGAT family acyltransferase
MATYPMSPVDAAWYHMDGPVNFAMITGIMLTREPLAFEKVKAVYRQGLASFDRFRQRVVEAGFPVATPHWEDMPDFDIGQQLHHIALPEPRDRGTLAGLISDLASTPLDHARPLWQVHVVDDVDGGSALIMRIHHCIGDGTAAMVVCNELFGTTPDAPRPEPPATTRENGRSDDLLAPAFAPIGKAVRLAVDTARTTFDAVAHPTQLFAKARLVLEGASMLAAELLKSPDPRSPLKGSFGLEKRVAWSEPVALADVKAIGATAGAKINDVLVAATTGALRTYLRRRGVDVDQVGVRAIVPVDLRPPARALELGNEFGLVILELPLQARRSRDRLRLTKQRMDALKRSPEPVAILALFDLFGRGPKAAGDLAVDLFGSKASLVMTNVAGPQRTVHLAGVPVDRLMFWVPHPGRQLGMGISILSYKGEATLAVVADAHLVPDPEAITSAFGREFARMSKAARMPSATPQGANTLPRRRRAGACQSPA